MKKTLLILGTLLVGFCVGYNQAEPVNAIAANGVAHATAHPAAHPATHAEATHTTATHTTTEGEHTATVNDNHPETSNATHHTFSTWMYGVTHPGGHRGEQYTKGYNDGYKNGAVDKRTKSHKHSKPQGKVSKSYYKGYVHGYNDGAK